MDKKQPMNAKIVDGNTVEITHSFSLDAVMEKAKEEFIHQHYDSYYGNDLREAVTKKFMEKYGDQVVEELKEKLLTGWVEVFKSEVLKKALQEVMSGRNY